MKIGMSGSAIEHDQRGPPVVEGDDGDGSGGQDRGDEERGQIRGEVQPQAVQAAGDQDRGVIAALGELAW